MATEQDTAEADGSGAKRVLLLGATGTIGQATARALMKAGHDVTCFIRGGSEGSAGLAGTTVRTGNPLDTASLEKDGFAGEAFDVVVSCLASRTGTPTDSWRIDHDAHQALLKTARMNGVRHFILLSAICVQQPELAFQKAKLSFEKSLIESGLTYSIVRPTAFFKSLSGQISRVQDGKPFLLFGDGSLTSCKPISDRDLAAFITSCISDEAKQDAVLPIGGPGPAMTLKQQGELLFELVGQPPKFQSVPPGVFRILASLLGAAGTVIRPLKEKAALLQIAHYYATHSMLLWDDEAQRYDAAATPEFGSDTLRAHYAAVLNGDAEVGLGSHAVFDRKGQQAAAGAS